MSIVWNLNIERLDYDTILIDLFSEIKKMNIPKIKINILMHNEVYGKTLEAVRKLFSNTAQNMQYYNIKRHFYFTIEIADIDKLIRFLEQDWATYEDLVEAPTPAAGDEHYQNYNFWEKIIVCLPNNKLIFNKDGIEYKYNSATDTTKINNLINNKFINYLHHQTKN